MSHRMSHRQECPICGADVPPSPRYPDYVCADCAGRATAADGQGLRFENLSLSGGYLARYAASGDVYDSHTCYIDGLECCADEAYLGGIVIRARQPAS